MNNQCSCNCGKSSKELAIDLFKIISAKQDGATSTDKLLKLYKECLAAIKESEDK